MRVAGVQIGLISKVDAQERPGVVTADIEPKWIKKLDMHTDTTALLRPRTGLKDMFIELEPGLERSPS